jgi:hypothetical protein
MAIRTLRRKVIIREYDFKKVRDEAFAPLGISESLYDRAEFIPFTKDSLSRDYLMKVLGDRTKINLARPNQHPANWLFDMKDSLYSPKYINYHPEYDEEGYVWVQARKNTPRTRLGWAVFEKDLTCRI